MNLCPFAEKTFQNGQIYVCVTEAKSPELVYQQLEKTMLEQAGKQGTTLMVSSNFYADDFESFNDFLSAAQDQFTLDHPHLDGVLQVVPFHPLFRFEGSQQEDQADNFTNRSPHPVFHILREDEVKKAVDVLQGDASRVWKRNVDLLHSIEDEFGKEQLRLLVGGSSLEDEASRKTLGGILKKHRIIIAR